MYLQALVVAPSDACHFRDVCPISTASPNAALLQTLATPAVDPSPSTKIDIAGHSSMYRLAHLFVRRTAVDEPAMEMVVPDGGHCVVAVSVCDDACTAKMRTNNPTDAATADFSVTKCLILLKCSADEKEFERDEAKQM